VSHHANNQINIAFSLKGFGEALKAYQSEVGAA
jgi:invasion protein IalB